MPPLSEFLTFAAVGAFAQLVDGALGMAHGLASNSILLALAAAGGCSGSWRSPARSSRRSPLGWCGTCPNAP